MTKRTYPSPAAFRVADPVEQTLAVYRPPSEASVCVPSHSRPSSWWSAFCSATTRTNDRMISKPPSRSRSNWRSTVRRPSCAFGDRHAP
jgi:hypothetical protein